MIYQKLSYNTWYRHHIEILISNSQLPKPGNTTQSLHLSAPWLQDLLNPAPLDSNSDEKSEPTFMFNDPYSTNLLDEDNDSEMDDEPTITWGFQVERLDIKNVVDLANKKLLAC